MNPEVREMTTQERFAKTPRPLEFIRVRLSRGGQAQYIQHLLEDERDQLYEELGSLREDGKSEDDPEIVEVQAHLRFLIAAARDISTGMIELA